MVYTSRHNKGHCRLFRSARFHFSQAVKVWAKGGMDVKLYEQNEDDAIYNRVTLLAEERVACAVVDLKGVYLLEAE